MVVVYLVTSSEAGQGIQRACHDWTGFIAKDGRHGNSGVWSCGWSHALAPSLIPSLIPGV